ncbi:unnamed protein product [Symbiodinium sp. KB8]|nr:unnamed protein product [Symbiodinium sp. KB8]
MSASTSMMGSEPAVVEREVCVIGLREVGEEDDAAANVDEDAETPAMAWSEAKHLAEAASPRRLLEAAPSQGLPQADDPPGHQMPRTAATSELVSTDIRSGHSVLNAQAVPADRSQKTGRGAVALGGQGKGFQGKGGRRRPGGRQQGRGENGRTHHNPDNRSFSSGSTEDTEDAEILHLLAKTVVRHEDSINILRRSTGWMWWARSGEGSILPLLSDLARKWSEAANSQEIQPNRVSLRVTLLWGLLTCLQEKVTNLTQDQMAFAIRSSWADANGGWNFQKWDAHHQTLVVDTSRPPLSTAQVKESLGTLLQAINGDTLTRFSATQEIRADAQGKITFHADISLRAPGSDALYKELVRLQGSAVFQIIGVQFKPEGYHRPPLIRRLQQLIG